ncbi:CDP-alcohol phosphatidyltransferase [Histoplasma capsulatum var. duboisii H88]|uniref:CDP-alcohol phosphatidyltransferase n=1 Tax=Ajellomyces capsulatus (strain H88) TaxID=544711 RepID=F0UBY0_AJEC8|nr:CDP-alcohol phosphatidyltransferase [Histoplasma capsulatum var. duboisii H88]
MEVPPSKSSISDAEDRVGTPWYLAPHSRISPGFKIFAVSRCPLCPARHSRFAGRGSLQRKGQSSQKNMVVAFDINGVLLHDDKITPESRRVRELLNGDNELGIKIPYMLLTNGSGKTEALPSPPYSPSNPTRPFKLVPNRVSRPALPQRRTDSKTSSSQDTLAWGPSISPPWRNFTEKDHKQARPQDFDNVTFHSILVFADSCDYATDFQITMELLLSENGRLRTKANNSLAKQMPIHFLQGNIIFQTDHKLLRMTQGPFRIALETMYKSLTTDISSE